MIHYKLATLEDISDDMLFGYKRYTHTTKVYVVKDQQLHQKEIEFTEEWDQEKLQEITRHFRTILQTKGRVLLAYDKERVIGFTTIDNHLYFDTYIDMPYIHVSQEYRGQHIGQTLFEQICQEAKTLGAIKLYISAHPSIETIHFYQKMGCHLTEKIIPELFALEPYDIQLEKVL